MKNESDEPTVPRASPLPQIRHDGWTGDKMAVFCETLAETAVVAEACDEARMGISGAYAHRRRNPFFAVAWNASLTIARERLADTLLARSMEGNIEQLYKDGELVGERHTLDNNLGLALLRRLDRLAETGSPLHSNPSQVTGTKRSAPAIIPHSQSFDWEAMVDALRTGDPDAIAQALTLLEGNKVEEVEDPPIRPPSDEQDETYVDLSDRYWLDDVDEMWMTDFPPPAEFDAWQSGPYGEGDYYRACTPQEIAIIEADIATHKAAERAADEALRDAWFAFLKDGPPAPD